MTGNVTLGQTEVKVTDILTLISQGYSYGQILKEYPSLTVSDIMTSAAFAADILTRYVETDGDIRIEGKIVLAVKNGKIVDLTKLREDFPRAYEPWKTHEENQLVDLFHRGQKIAEIAKSLQRQPGAVRARLEKLGLMK